MRNDDRELLELAAKAAGLSGNWQRELDENQENWRFIVPYQNPGLATGYYWNPIADDGDALRLAAALKFTVDFESGAVWGAGDLDETRLGHATADEPCMRRAIVRAAAEIGRRIA